MHSFRKDASRHIFQNVIITPPPSECRLRVRLWRAGADWHPDWTGRCGKHRAEKILNLIGVRAWAGGRWRTDGVWPQSLAPGAGLSAALKGNCLWAGRRPQNISGPVWQHKSTHFRKSQTTCLKSMVQTKLLKTGQPEANSKQMLCIPYFRN